MRSGRAGRTGNNNVTRLDPDMATRVTFLSYIASDNVTRVGSGPSSRVTSLSFGPRSDRAEPGRAGPSPL